jgi:hypothetical protein
MQSFITIIIKGLVPTQTEPNGLFWSFEVFFYKHFETTVPLWVGDACLFINTSGVHKSNPVLLLTKKDKKLLSLGIQKKYKNPATSGKKREFSRAVVSYWLYNLARATVACIFKSLPSGHRRRSYRAQSDASPKTFMNPRGDLSGLKRGVHLRETRLSGCSNVLLNQDRGSQTPYPAVVLKESHRLGWILTPCPYCIRYVWSGNVWRAPSGRNIWFHDAEYLLLCTLSESCETEIKGYPGVCDGNHFRLMNSEWVSECYLKSRWRTSTSCNRLSCSLI